MGAMVDVAERWMRIGGRGGRYKIEADDGGQMGHPTEFCLPKSNKTVIILDVRRN